MDSGGIIRLARSASTKEELDVLARELQREGYGESPFGNAEVALMGHRVIVGHVSDVVFAGVSWVKVRFADGEWKLFSPAAIYSISPVSEDYEENHHRKLDDEDDEDDIPF